MHSSGWFTDRISWCRISFSSSSISSWRFNFTRRKKERNRWWWINAISSNRIVLANSQIMFHRYCSKDLQKSSWEHFQIDFMRSFRVCLNDLRLFGKSRKHERKKCVSKKIRKKAFLGPTTRNWFEWNLNKVESLIEVDNKKTMSSTAVLIKLQPLILYVWIISSKAF